MTRPVKIVAVLTALPGKESALASLLEGMVAPSRAEAGNQHYDLWRDAAEPGRFVIDELYADQAALAAHRASPHYAAYLASITSLAERTAYVLEGMQVA